MTSIWLPLCVWATGLSEPQSPEAPQQAGDPKAITDTGLRFASLMAEGSFKAASEMVNEYIATTLNPTNLELSWITQAHELGEFRRVGEPIVVPHARHRIVRVICEWERGSRALELVMDKNYKITGLQWVPPERTPPDLGPVSLPYAVIEQEVMIGSKPWELPAVLALPSRGGSKAAVVFVGDAGSKNRDGAISRSRPLFYLAGGLADRGVVSLRYDKRTFYYQKQLDGVPITTQEEYLDDALAALAFLRSYKETKDLPIYLLGHGRGGVVAPWIAEKDGKLAGVIILGAVARPTEEALIDYFTYLESIETRKDSLSTLEELRLKIGAIRTRTLDPDELVLGAGPKYWYDLCDRDGEAAVAKAASLPCRILVIHGGRDFDATVDDFHLWKAGLAKHPDAEFELYDDLNHHFVRGKDKSTPREYDLPKPVDDRVMIRIANWCTKAP